MKNIRFFIWKVSFFWGCKIFNIFEWACFRNGGVMVAFVLSLMFLLCLFVGASGRLCFEMIICITKTRLFTTPTHTHKKKAKFSDKKKSDIFHISAQNIYCEYSLEPPRRGGSNEYPQSMFLANKKNNVYPCKPQFYYIKWGLRGQNYIGMFSWWYTLR